MISHQEAKRLADAHLLAEDSSLVAAHATRERGVWEVDYCVPGRPDEQLQGGGLVVLDGSEVHDVGSTPDAVHALLLDLRLVPATDTDAESLAPLADGGRGAAGLGRGATTRGGLG